MNLTFSLNNADIYFIQKAKDLNKTVLINKDIVVNITDDQTNKKIKVNMDVDYDNNTKVVVGENKISFEKKTDNVKEESTKEEDQFLKQKLQQKGNQIIKESVLDCADANNGYTVQTVCSLCNVISLISSYFFIFLHFLLYFFIFIIIIT